MPSATIEQLLETSQWVFNGTVEKPASSSLKSLPASARTVTVKVVSILHGPPQLNDHINRLVTVYTAEGAPPLKPGDQLAFFTRSWLYGESMAVVEVGRMEEQKTPGLKSQLEESGQNVADRRLIDRLNRAEIVIVGKVRSVEPAKVELRSRIESEHNPDWWQADIDVESVVKGALQAKTLSILFPHSGDEMWLESAKFTVGQEGIWILQRNQQEKGWPVMRVPGLTALHPLDFQTKDQVARIRTLLQRR